MGLSRDLRLPHSKNTFDSQLTDGFVSVFIFPFKYSKYRNGKRQNGNISPTEIADQLQPKWKPKNFFDTASDEEAERRYNQWHYFYPWVRSMIFSVANSRMNGKGKAMQCLERCDFRQFSVNYHIRNEKTKEICREELSLPVDSIELNLFDNQIGLLAIRISQGRQSMSFKDLLMFNDLARRVSPQYLDPHKPANTDAAKDSGLLPDRVTLSNLDDTVKIEEDFAHMKDPSRGRYLSKIITTLLQPLQPLPDDDHGYTSAKDPRYFFGFVPFTDDRMFTLSVFGDKNTAERLKTLKGGHYGFECDDTWFRFLFINGESPQIDNDLMKESLIRTHTYTRWAQRGNLYGMSQYSFVMVHDGSVSFLNHHARGAYYRMALIILLQRAMLLKFSNDVKDLAREFKKTRRLTRGTSKQLYGKAETLRDDFIRFTNEYWHTEITPNEQGTEIYRKWMSLLHHEHLFTKVNNEITELTTHFRLAIDRDRNKALKHITEMGLPISVIVVVVSIWRAAYPPTERFLSASLYAHINPWQLSLLILFVAASGDFLFQLLRALFVDRGQ